MTDEKLFKGIGHIALNVSDLEASLRFYTEQLGLKPAFQLTFDVPGGGGFHVPYLLLAPGQFIELFPTGVKKVERDHQTVGFAHICIVTEDVEQALQTLTERGAPVDSGITVGKAMCKQFWTHDPDGNPIEIMELPPESLQARYG